jgi:hypothetical protein
MRVLILTPINPLYSAEIYHELAAMYNKTNVGILCFPFFAYARSQSNNLDYVPTYFAMIQQSLEPLLNRRLYDKQNMIVIGNVYKDQQFDLIVSYNKNQEDEMFDTYLETIKQDEDFQEFKNKVDLDNLYSLDDAEFNLPTVEHIKLFLEGVFR